MINTAKELLSHFNHSNTNPDLIEHIKKFDEKKEVPKFKVGDRVVVPSNYSRKGTILTVFDSYPQAQECHVIFDDGSFGYFYLEHLQQLIKVEEPKFKVGDIVSVTHCKNYVGRITQIDRFHLRAFLVGTETSFDFGWEYLDHLLHYSSKPKKIKKIVNDGTTDYTLTDKINEIVDHLNNI